MSEWKVNIQRKVGYWLDEIYVFRTFADNRGQFIEFLCPGNERKAFPYSDGMMTDQCPPFLRMDPREMQAFLVAFREALKSFNLPSSDESRMRGELDATKLHLADMQKLVFKGSPHDR